jgi:hypothetical protein
MQQCKYRPWVIWSVLFLGLGLPGVSTAHRQQANLDPDITIKLSVGVNETKGAAVEIAASPDSAPDGGSDSATDSSSESDAQVAPDSDNESTPESETESSVGSAPAVVSEVADQGAVNGSGGTPVKSEQGGGTDKGSAATASDALAPSLPVGQAGPEKTPTDSATESIDSLDDGASGSGEPFPESPTKRMETKTPKSNTQAAVSQAVRQTDDLAEVEKRAYRLSVFLSHGVGSGTFLQGSSFDYARYVAQSWSLGGSYTTALAGQTLTLGGSWSFDWTLTVPNSNPARRFQPYDLQAYVRAPDILTIPGVGVNLSASLKFYFPISYASRQVTQRWLAVAASWSLSRSFGPVSLSYSFNARKAFNGSLVAVAGRSVARGSDPVPNGQGSIAFGSGYANTQWDIQNAFGVSYNHPSHWGLSYSFMLWHALKYTLQPTRDEFTSIHAQTGLQNGADVMISSIEASYALSESLKDLLDWPVELSLALGISAFHPAKEPDNKSFIAPVIVNAFLGDKAANNYGSIYLQIGGSY